MVDKEKEALAGDSTTDLKPNVAGLLCYVGIWVTGIIFLIIEKKHTMGRFHAMQSLVSFGILSTIINGADAVRGWTAWTVRGWFFYPQWIAANIVFGVFVAITCVLWIILMHQTDHGHLVKVPLFGDLALKLLAKLDGISKEDFEQKARYLETQTAPEQPSEKADSHFASKRSTRIASSAGAIAWSVALLVFFTFFSQYLAFYQGETVDGGTKWNIYPLLTQDFGLVLPILNATLILSIVGHGIAIAFDKYIIREINQIVLHLLGMATVLTFLRIFPFDFSVIPNTDVATVAPTIAIVVLTIIAAVLGIEALVRFIRLIINVLKHD